MTDKKPFWEIKYAYDDGSKAKPEKPVLGIVPAVIRGNPTITPDEAKKFSLPLPEKSDELSDNDEVARDVAALRPIIPGEPPTK